tara:strand:+ start:1451 stop:1651 length:201 start_codon:yes stop_codon:yes gene_type:complete
MYRGCGVDITTNEMVISEKEITMNLAVVVLLMVYISLCVVIVGGWAFKTLDDIGIELDENDKDSIL